MHKYNFNDAYVTVATKLDYCCVHRKEKYFYTLKWSGILVMLLSLIQNS